MISPTAWLERLQQELRVARAGDDPEGVHQMRVAAARLRVWLELGGRRALVDDLRWLRRSGGDVRDLDVLIAENTRPECAGWLSDRREEARRKLLAALDDERVDAMFGALACMPPLERSEARKNLAKLVKHALRAGAKTEKDETDVTRWHELRRTLRKLRYAREWLDEDTKKIHELLDVLGELNNRVVEARHLAECPEKGAQASLASVHEKIDAQRKLAAKGWSALRGELEAG